MKKRVTVSVLYSLLLREISSINLCFPDKYEKYKIIFTKAFNAVSNEPISLEYSFYHRMDDYLKKLV